MRLEGFRTTWRRFRRNRGGVVGVVVLAAVVVLALGAEWLAPHDPFGQDLYLGYTEPSLSHPLGTDEFGRDLASRIIYGARISLMVGVVSVSIALVLGTLAGLVAGYYGGWLDTWLMRLMDLMLAFPAFLLAIVVVAVLGPSLTNAMIAVGIVRIPQYARLVRGSVLSLKEAEFVTAHRALGAGDPAILGRSILLNALPPLIVQTTLGMGTSILEAASLSFVGLGAQPPSPEWGAMMIQGRQLLLRAPWVVTCPGVAIFLTVLGFNMAGDALRDALDPRMVRQS